MPARKKTAPLRLLLASSELHPYSKSGGLADMVAALAKHLGRAGHQVGIVTPLYRGIAEKYPDLRKLDYELELPLGATMVSAEVWTRQPSEGVTVYFISQPEFYQRASLYIEKGISYPDNAARFIYFTKCVVHLSRYLAWQPEIVHVHDWQCALAPLMILDQHRREGWGRVPRSVLTIHNLAFQGNFPRPDYALTNLPWEYFNLHAAEFYGQMDCLKAGIVFADLVTTVSPRYAREIVTPEFGCGLDPALRTRGNSLLGILNGVDYDEWNTENNPYIKHPYSALDLTGKLATKLELQNEFHLPVNAEIPLFASITRLADQKGIDIALGALEEMLHRNIQFVLLGSGSPEFERAFLGLAERFPQKVGVRLGYDAALSHRIEAGADFFLMPSFFEPCGLNQMYSQRYGTIPIVRVTGGLDDSVRDFTEVESDDGYRDVVGIKFRSYTSRALAKAMQKALAVFEKPELLRHLRVNAMRADYSWEKTAEQYVTAYRDLIGLREK